MAHTNTLTIAAALLVLAWAGVPCAWAQPEFPSTPPEPGTPKDFKVPEPRRFSLDNGLQVTLVQWGTMPKVRVTLRIRSGNAFEKANEV